MVEQIIPSSSVDEPCTYRIRVRGRLSQQWVESMWANIVVTIDATPSECESILQGEVIDQAHLLGIFNTLYNMGYPVIGLEEIAAEGDPAEKE